MEHVRWKISDMGWSWMVKPDWSTGKSKPETELKSTNPSRWSRWASHWGLRKPQRNIYGTSQISGHTRSYAPWLLNLFYNSSNWFIVDISILFLWFINQHSQNSAGHHLVCSMYATCLQLHVGGSRSKHGESVIRWRPPESSTVWIMWIMPSPRHPGAGVLVWMVGLFKDQWWSIPYPDAPWCWNIFLHLGHYWGNGKRR